MTLVGLMHVRNEDWVLGLSLPAAMDLVDHMIVLDHASTDDTPNIIAAAQRSNPDRITMIPWTGRHYNEAAIRLRLLEEGRRLGGTHFFMIDADEIVTGPHVDAVREATLSLEPAACLELPWLAMWDSLDHYRDDDSVWANNFKTFAFADAPSVTFAAYGDGYDMHQRPRGIRTSPERPWSAMSDGGVMHLQFADRRRLLAKQAWYKMSETVRFPGRSTPDEINAKYGPAVDDTGLKRTRVGQDWWTRYDALLSGYHPDRAPWHEAEIARFWHEHGRDFFTGLDLWGVPERAMAETAWAENGFAETHAPTGLPE